MSNPKTPAKPTKPSKNPPKQKEHSPKPPKIEGNDFVINLDDFKSIRIIIAMNNLTTKTQISDGRRIYDGKFDSKYDENLAIYLLEFLEAGLILEVPKKSCAQGHNVLLNLRTDGFPVDLEFEVTAKVEQMDVLDNGKNKITLKFTQFNDKDWKAFQNLFNTRQKEIETFFESMKGR